MKLEVEQNKLGLIAAGKFPAGAAQFEVTKNVRLMPKFDKKDVEFFFYNVQKEHTLMWQRVFTGKAQKCIPCIPPWQTARSTER